MGCHPSCVCYEDELFSLKILHRKVTLSLQVRPCLKQTPSRLPQSRRSIQQERLWSTCQPLLTASWLGLAESRLCLSSAPGKQMRQRLIRQGINCSGSRWFAFLLVVTNVLRAECCYRMEAPRCLSNVNGTYAPCWFVLVFRAPVAFVMWNGRVLVKLKAQSLLSHSSSDRTFACQTQPQPDVAALYIKQTSLTHTFWGVI